MLVDQYGKPLLPEDNVQVPIDELDAKIMSKGSWSSKLSENDKRKLRMIVKKVHMKYYPSDMITDYEADKMIEAIGPQTAEYLIKKHIEGQK